MILKKFVLGPIENNNYLLIDEIAKEAVLIDCTENSKEIEESINQYNAKLKYILLTHGHFDHILGVNDFKAKHPDCKVLVHEADNYLLENIKDFARNYGLGDFEVQKADGFIKEGDIIEFGKHKIKVIHTPGHTQGCVCYILNDKLFSGDTLFYESVGRTDLPGGSFEQIKKSIQEKLFILDEHTTVYPGHGWESSIGHEKINNKFM